MKRICLAVVFLSVILLSGCSGGAAVAFNNDIVELQKELDVKVTALSAKMNGADSIKQLSLIPEMKEMVVFIDKKEKELTALKGPDEGAMFQKSMVAQFSFLKNLYEQNIKFLDANLSEKEKNILAIELQLMMPEAKKLEEETSKAQQEFAKKSGITVK